MEKEHILLTVAYDGTNYCGWQIQNGVETVQGVLEQALTRLFKVPVAMLGASRTDAGVHAMGQRTVVHLPAGTCNVPLNKLPEVVNIKLPKDVRVMCAEAVDEAFHPIFDAKRKTYTYTIHNAAYANPMFRNMRYHEKIPLDVAQMHCAAQHFIGTHDFESFRAIGGTTKTSVRTMYEAGVHREGEAVLYTVTGSGFLYNMVRIMAGTLLLVGTGKLAAEDVPGIIASRNRARAGKTMPPQGLMLMRVRYEAD